MRGAEASAATGEAADDGGGNGEERFFLITQWLIVALDRWFGIGTGTFTYFSMKYWLVKNGIQTPWIVIIFPLYSNFHRIFDYGRGKR